MKQLPSSFAKATEDKSGVRMCKYYKEYASQTDWLFRFKFSVWRIERTGERYKAAKILRFAFPGDTAFMLKIR